MAKRWTQEAAFAQFNAKRKNPRWSWSAKSDDGKTVVVTLWQDEFENGGKTYRSRGAYAGKLRAGGTELLVNLRWAIDHCDGLVRVVMAVARDVKANPRSIASCFPHPSLLMRVKSLDENARTFELERVNT